MVRSLLQMAFLSITEFLPNATRIDVLIDSHCLHPMNSAFFKCVRCEQPTRLGSISLSPELRGEYDTDFCRPIDGGSLIQSDSSCRFCLVFSNANKKTD